MADLFPKFPRVVADVLARATHVRSLLHGVGHWKCVAHAGLQLLPDVPGCDPAVVLLFGLFHDAMRQNDGHDPDHGRRAARLVRDLRGSFDALAPARLDLLEHACAEHADGTVTGDPTVGTCWDADRLNLWRVGIRPTPRYLCTAAAKRPRRIAWAERLHGQHLTWKAIHDAFSAAAAPAAASGGGGGGGGRS